MSSLTNVVSDSVSRLGLTGTFTKKSGVVTLSINGTLTADIGAGVATWIFNPPAVGFYPIAMVHGWTPVNSTLTAYYKIDTYENNTGVQIGYNGNLKSGQSVQFSISYLAS